jgi:hypothetical protein
VGPGEPVRGPALSTVAMRTVIGLVVLAVAVLLIAAVWAGRRADDPSRSAGDVVRVGVVQGQSVPGYLSSTRAELAALTDPSAPAAGDTWALVSLDRYVPAGALTGMLDGTSVAQVYTRVPLAGRHTPVVLIPVLQVPADVLSGMLDAAVRRDREQAEYQQLSRKIIGDDSNADRARRAYDSAAATAAQEAAAYRSGCSCVFAAVVRAAPAVLQGVADRPGVRVVDPAPEVRQLDRVEFRPPLPEQDGTIPAEPSGSPIPVPNAGSAIASRTPPPITSSGLPASSEPRVTSDSSASGNPRPDPSAPASEELSPVPSAT